MEFTSKLIDKAKKLGFPYRSLIVEIEFNEKNSSLVKATGKTIINMYGLKDIVDRGVLIGKTGHLQLIEWEFVKDIYS